MSSGVCLNFESGSITSKCKKNKHASSIQPEDQILEMTILVVHDQPQMQFPST